MGERARRVQKQAGLTPDGVYGPKTRASVMQGFIPKFQEAISFAENNKRNHGVLSIPTNTPEEAIAIRNNSARNAMERFMAEKANSDTLQYQPDQRFLDYFRERWAPDNAPNDPKNLNQNWAPNARYYLKKKYPQQYEQWKAMNLVQQPQMTGIGVA